MKLLLLILLGCASSSVYRFAPLVEYESVSDHRAESPHQMVTSQGKYTTQESVKILKMGGNAIDAFVAASFMISVERPHSTGIGGGGFLVYYSQQDQKFYAFDFRESAPLRSYEEMYLDKYKKEQPLLSQEGGLSIAVPGLVRGLYQIHQKFGKLPWEKVVAPSIELATNGFKIYPKLYEALEDRKDLLIKDPEAKKIFFKNDQPLQIGETLIQKNLAQTLRIISKTKDRDFYQGSIANKITQTVRKRGGILILDDLKKYEVKERIPLKGNYKDYEIVSMPPPSSGGIHLIQILKMLEPYNLKKKGFQTTESIHLIAQAMQLAYMDRAHYLGDSDFHQVPVKMLLDQKYLSDQSNRINTYKKIPSKDLKFNELPYESDETTHFSLVDNQGNMVSSTQTINGWFGSGVMAEGTGIILNNEMDDFSQKIGASNLFGAIGGKGNLIAPKKRPLSSMTPTIVLKNNKPLMAVGTPSGTRIITCVLQTILNKIEYGLSLYEAVSATRIHHQWYPDELRIEAPYLDPKVERQLVKRGHQIKHQSSGCSIQAIAFENDRWIGVSDPRNEGMALGR